MQKRSCIGLRLLSPSISSPRWHPTSKIFSPLQRNRFTRPSLVWKMSSTRSLCTIHSKRLRNVMNCRLQRGMQLELHVRSLQAHSRPSLTISRFQFVQTLTLSVQFEMTHIVLHSYCFSQISFSLWCTDLSKVVVLHRLEFRQHIDEALFVSLCRYLNSFFDFPIPVITIFVVDFYLFIMPHLQFTTSFIVISLHSFVHPLSSLVYFAIFSGLVSVDSSWCDESCWWDGYNDKYLVLIVRELLLWEFHGDARMREVVARLIFHTFAMVGSPSRYC